MPRALSDDERARLLAVQRVLQHAVSSSSEDDVVAEQRNAYLSLGVDGRDGTALKATDHRRIVVYRGLVRRGLCEVLRNEMPRAMDALGDAFDRYTRTYFETELPRSQILRDVAYEFAVWATPSWRSDEQVPQYLADLARFELLEFDVYTALRPTLEAGDELGADRAVVFDGSARLAHFDWSVHIEDEEPARGRVDMLCYRDDDGELRRMDLTPLAGEIMGALLLDGIALAESVQRGCKATGDNLDQRVIDGTAKVLEDLAKRGVVLGSQPVSTSAGEPENASPFARWLFRG
jgi:hypothetical protein